MRYCFFVLVFLSLIRVNAQKNLDYRVLKSLNVNEYPALDETMRWTSHGVYPFMVLGAGGVWLDGYLRKDQEMMRNGYKCAIGIGTTVLISETLKRSIKRTRPYNQYPGDIILRTKNSGFSFPSGHTCAAFATATSLTLSTKKWQFAVPAFTYAGVVGYSRMRLGAHYGSDVLAGIIIGVGSSLLTWQVDKWVRR
jgi:membrane-associated phospholipid phosphatase